MRTEPPSPPHTSRPMSPALPGSPIPNAEPPEIDLAHLWDQVMRARPLDLAGPPSAPGSFPSSFHSATDSDASAEPFEDAGTAYNPATYGISAETHIKSRFLVEATTEGEL